MIRRATLEDLRAIMEIIQDTVLDMNKEGNYQWNSSYPLETDFIKDIDKGDLFLEEENGEVLGFICLNMSEAEEYKELKWDFEGESVVIHRMAVNPKSRNKGVGSKLMKYAEEFALSHDISYIKTDTNEINIKMNNLFKKCGYKLFGKVQLKGYDSLFPCYGKAINK